MIDGGAKVVGFDVVFQTSIEQSEIPFGDDLVGGRLRGFDRNYLRSLAKGAAGGKIVLGEVLRSNESIRPSPGQRIAVGQQKNIRPLNIYSDADDVVRRVPLTFPVDSKPIPSMALELASRALNGELVIGEDGSVTLAGYRVPDAVPNTLTLNFEAGDDECQNIFARGPSGLRRKQQQGFLSPRICRQDRSDRLAARSGGPQAYFQAFCDRARGIAGAALRACARPIRRRAIQAQFDRRRLCSCHRGQNLIARDAVVETGRLPTALIAIVFAAIAALAARLLAPGAAAAAYVGMVAVWTGCAVLAFTRSLALPLSEPLLAGFASMVAIVAYRLVVADKGERLLRKSFALYLAPQVIEKMVASKKMPELGGETREVTVFFSDLAGFSSISEQMSPEDLVTFMNEYLSAMSDIIEGYGGYIDKYMGDSIVAVFGAPADDDDHAGNAARAALDCRARLGELNQDSAAFQGYTVAHRMGLNSGEALVGNIGSRRRFNYSVMSDAVNVASRLEGANKYYGTEIIASEMTVALTGATFSWRELDAIRVQGRAAPVKVYELLAVAGQEAAQQAVSAAAYAQGLGHWRQREFEAAAKCFERAAEADTPSALFLRRANAFVDEPPGADWEPVNTLDGK